MSIQPPNDPAHAPRPATLDGPIHGHDLGAPPPNPDGNVDASPDSAIPLWKAPFAMLFTPGRFFRSFAPRCPLAFVFLLAYMGGLMKYDGRMQMRYDPTHPTFGQFFDSWGLYWGVGAVTALLSAALVVALGGWFYRVRIRWCGVPNADVRLSNTIFITADTFTYFSGFLALSVASIRYDNPAEYFYTTDMDWLALLPLVFLLWSPVMSYRALREVFGINQGSGLVWFLILPIVMRFIALALIAIGMLLIGFSHFSEPPDTDQPAVFANGSITFEYPGNWNLEVQDEQTLVVSPPQDAMVKFLLYQSDEAPLDEIEYTIIGLEAVGFELDEHGSFASYAGQDGEGLVFRDTQYNLLVDYELRVFVTPLPDQWMLEAQHLYVTDDANTLDPGFDLIERTLRVTSSGP